MWFLGYIVLMDLPVRKLWRISGRGFPGQRQERRLLAGIMYIFRIVEMYKHDVWSEDCLEVRW